MELDALRKIKKLKAKVRLPGEVMGRRQASYLFVILIMVLGIAIAGASAGMGTGKPTPPFAKMAVDERSNECGWHWSNGTAPLGWKDTSWYTESVIATEFGNCTFRSNTIYVQQEEIAKCCEKLGLKYAPQNLSEEPPVSLEINNVTRECRALNWSAAGKYYEEGLPAPNGSQWMPYSIVDSKRYVKTMKGICYPSVGESTAVIKKCCDELGYAYVNEMKNTYAAGETSGPGIELSRFNWGTFLIFALAAFFLVIIATAICYFASKRKKGKMRQKKIPSGWQKVAPILAFFVLLSTGFLLFIFLWQPAQAFFHDLAIFLSLEKTPVILPHSGEKVMLNVIPSSGNYKISNYRAELKEPSRYIYYGSFVGAGVGFHSFFNYSDHGLGYTREIDSYTSTNIKYSCIRGDCGGLLEDVNRTIQNLSGRFPYPFNATICFSNNAYSNVFIASRDEIAESTGAGCPVR